ncbi:MAG TPA: VanW family protein [Chloroflexota bacterium]|nr:VanW family protein [Chloroflexota bacterium]
MSRSVHAVPPTASRPVSFIGLIVGLGAVPVLAIVTIALFEMANWDKVTPGATALGTSVGGLSQSEAIARLTPSVQQLLDRPLDIQGGGQSWHTTARDLGLRLDPNELVGAAYQLGRQGSPFDRLGEQIDTLAHGHAVSAASTTDRAALDTSLAAMARQIERQPVDARLSLSNTGAIQAAGAQNGLTVDVSASRDQVTAALNGGGQTVALVTNSLPPAIPDEQLQAAHEQLDRLFDPNAGALTVTFADKSWPLERADVLKLVSLTGGTKPGQPAVVKIDDAPLKAWAARLSKDIDQTVQDARFAFNGGDLKVLRPSRQGRTLDQDGTVQAVHAALLAGDRTVSLPVTTVDPSVSSDDPQALGITELIDRGNTSFAGSIAEKKHNIQLAAQRLNGVVVAPGATFSFNDAVGPTTIDAGFQWGFGITSGDNGPRTVPSVAGGICQVATTLFQPVFWSGYQLEERYWHLYWIPAYTSRGVVGLDVTVDGDAGLDFKWTNPTPNYVLIQADTDADHIYFGLYGKKPNWQVQVDDAVITNRVPPDPKPIAQEEPTLPWGRTLLVESARDGFDAEVVRRVIPADGSKPRELDLKSTYQPAHTVTLVGSAGKPANASIDDALQRVLDAQKPATPAPTPDAAQAGTNPAAPAATPPTGATAVARPATPATPAPTAAARPQTPAPAAKPTPKPAATNNGIAPTPTH